MTATVVDSTEVFQAFADATRLRLLNLLVEQELCVCDLCGVSIMPLRNCTDD